MNRLSTPFAADTTPSERLTTAYGWVRVGAHTGHIAGPLLGAAALLHSLSAVFVVAGAALFVCLLIVILGIPADPARAGADEGGAHESPEGAPGNRLALVVTNRPLVLLVLAGGLLAITLSWFEADGLTILNSQRPLGTTAYATLFTVIAVVTVLFQVPVARLTSRSSAARVLVAGAVVQGAGLATLVAAGSGYAVLPAAAVLLATGQMLYGPTATTVIAVNSPAHARATFQAAFSVTEDIGTAIGPVTGLALAAAAGAPAVWSTAALVCLLTAVTAAAATRRHRPGPSGRPAAEARHR